MSERKPHKRYRMVGWYNPFQLATTGVEVAIFNYLRSTRRRRRFQSVAKIDGPPELPFYGVSQADSDFWFDYIADIGDGFNSACAMAYYLIEPTLKLKREKREEQEEPSEYETKQGPF